MTDTFDTDDSGLTARDDDRAEHSSGRAAGNDIAEHGSRRTADDDRAVQGVGAASGTDRAEHSSGGAAGDRVEYGDPRVERTRAAALEAGLTILFDSGPDAVTHAAVASAARVSRTTLYKHWPTRGNLLFDVLHCHEPHAPVDPSGDVRTDLLAVLGELQGALSDPNTRRVFISILAQAHWDAETSEVRSALKADAMANMVAILDAAADSGQIVPGVVPSHAAGRVIGPLMFAALVSGDDVTDLDLDGIVDDWLATVRP